MGSKHDILTQGELDRYSVNSKVLKYLSNYASDKKQSEIAVLDWGCGRGRSVLKLRELGYNAYGIDIDTDVLQNGIDIVRDLGYSPTELLKPLEEVEVFQDSSFDFIFSEQVFEHVKDLDYVAREMARLLKPGGISVNRYPGTYTINEGHLFMPFVHWFPKNRVRYWVIYFYLLLGYGPQNWKGLENAGKAEKAETFYNYSIHKTFYRTISKSIATFAHYGLTVEYKINATARKWIPRVLKENGFPRGSFTLVIKKDK